MLCKILFLKSFWYKNAFICRFSYVKCHFWVENLFFVQKSCFRFCCWHFQTGNDKNPSKPASRMFVCTSSSRWTYSGSSWKFARKFPKFGAKLHGIECKVEKCGITLENLLGAKMGRDAMMIFFVVNCWLLS